MNYNDPTAPDLRSWNAEHSGFSAALSADGSIQLLFNGSPCDSFDLPRQARSVPATAALEFIRAALRFVNAGVQVGTMARVLDCLWSRVPLSLVPADVILVEAMPTAEGPGVQFLFKIKGSPGCLRVVPGDYSELLSPQEFENLMSNVNGSAGGLAAPADLQSDPVDAIARQDHGQGSPPSGGVDS